MRSRRMLDDSSEEPSSVSGFVGRTGGTGGGRQLCS